MTAPTIIIVWLSLSFQRGYSCTVFFFLHNISHCALRLIIIKKNQLPNPNCIYNVVAASFVLHIFLKGIVKIGTMSAVGVDDWLTDKKVQQKTDGNTK